MLYRGYPAGHVLSRGGTVIHLSRDTLYTQQYYFQTRDEKRELYKAVDP